MSHRDETMHRRQLECPTAVELTRKISHSSLPQVDGAPCVLEILDTAGTEQFASMRDLYIKNGHGFIVMYSLTNHQTFQVRSEYFQFCHFCFLLLKKPTAATTAIQNRITDCVRTGRGEITIGSVNYAGRWLMEQLSLSPPQMGLTDCRCVHLQDISNMKNVISRVKGSQPAPILLVANKLDLDCQREVSREEGTLTTPMMSLTG